MMARSIETFEGSSTAEFVNSRNPNIASLTDEPTEVSDDGDRAVESVAVLAEHSVLGQHVVVLVDLKFSALVRER